MRRSVARALVGGLMAAGLAVAAPALSQAAEQPSLREPAGSGLIQGIVRRVEYATGAVAVVSGSDVAILRGTPAQVAGMKIGDNVALPYQLYANMAWLDPSVGGGLGGSGLGQGSEQQQLSSGKIVGLNLPGGVLAVDSAQKRVILNAHPTLLKNLVPGQYVDFNFATVDGEFWLTNVQIPSGQEIGQ